MKKVSMQLCAFFTILLNIALAHAWEWPWKTQQAKIWTQKLAQHQARLRSLWHLLRGEPDEQELQSQQNRQDYIAHEIKEYWILSKKKETDMTANEVRIKNRIISYLLGMYADFNDFFGKIKNPTKIEIKTFELLKDWRYKYSNNKPDIHQKQR